MGFGVQSKLNKSILDPPGARFEGGLGPPWAPKGGIFEHFGRFVLVVRVSNKICKNYNSEVGGDLEAKDWGVLKN